MIKKWTAVAREASLAAEHLGIGVTALGRANYAFPAFYSQAFFALSIGLERSCKLALAINYAISNHGQFSTEQALRGYGHDLKALLQACSQLSACKHTLPASPIHNAIVDIISSFASNITRYYNLQVITESLSSAQVEDPMTQWQKKVVEPILTSCCKPKQIQEVHQRARAIDDILNPFTLIRHTAVDGTSLTTPYQASRQTGLTKLSTPYVRLHVLQIARPIAELLAELGYQAQSQKIDDVPNLADFFNIFMSDDKYFRTRGKTWSTYPRLEAS